MSRIVVVSNRVPAPGATQPGGLAVALDGLLARSGGLWFGWSGNVSPVARDMGMQRVGRVDYATIDLTPAEHDAYYNGHSNACLWPLLHSMPELARFDRGNARAYRQVNERLTDAMLPLLRPTDLIWVHDYHLTAMPSALRARGVTAPIGFFLHVPFPASDVFAGLPNAATVLRDLLAADLIGFQTQGDLTNFVNAAQVIVGAARNPAALPGQPVVLSLDGRRTRLGVFPVEIDAHEFAGIAQTAWLSPATERLRRSLGGQSLIFGVDRLDPTKGIPQRLAGYRRLLETRPHLRQRVTLLQIAAQSRTDVEAYRELRREIDREAGAVCSEWNEPDWTCLRVVARGGARNVVAGYMREARVGLVTPLRDGMNLVAKEFVAAQDPQDPGVLILSPYAGASQQLDGALLVNPRDADAMADAMDRALAMPLDERLDRWARMWGAIEQRTALGWGKSFLAALARPVVTTVERFAPRVPSLKSPVAPLSV